MPRTCARLVFAAILLAASRARAFDGGGGFQIVDGALSGEPQVDVFNYSGSSTTYTTTWTKPAWATVIHMWCVGGGSGGQGGNKNASASVASRSGGQSANQDENWCLAAELPSSLSVSIGRGGNGGSGATSNSATGGVSGTRGDSSIGISGCVRAPTVSSETACLVFAGGPNSSNYWLGVAGGAPQWSGVADQTCTGNTSYAPGAGAGGGSITSGVASDGYDGANGCFSPNSKGAAGTVTGTRAGTAGASYTSGRRVGGGGGGGAASVTAGINGGTGGAGGTPGGGGGAGGAGLNDTNNGGAGGKGGDGVCVITSY